MADMFPTIPTGAPAQTGDKIGRVPAFDSETNRFLLLDGALVERTGREAVQQWFDLMLRQRIDRRPPVAYKELTRTRQIRNPYIKLSLVNRSLTFRAALLSPTSWPELSLTY